MARENPDFVPRHRRPVDEPKGPKRADAMARAKDDLDERIETMPKEGIDPKKIAVDPAIRKVLVRNISRSRNPLAVSRALPEYEYGWYRWSGEFPQVQEKLGITVEVDGRIEPAWEIVTGTMPEALERKHVDGTRRIADVMLMRCHKDVHAVLRAEEEQRAQRMQERPMIDEETARRLRVPIVDMDSKRGKHAMEHAAANEIANRQMDNLIRQGRVPGVPAPGQ
jgi:hypothetical protein